MITARNHILILVFTILCSSEFYGQVTFKGFVTNENGEAVSAVIKDIKDGDFFFCDDSGYFNITFREKTSVIKFSALSYLPILVDIDTVDKNQFKLKMVQDSRYKEIVMIAPSPPFLEIGYNGRMNHSPFGIHSSFGKWGRKHQLKFDYSTKDLKSNTLINFSYSPGIIDFKKNRKINDLINPYLTGIYSDLDTVSNSRALICNNTLIKYFISINYGIGLNSGNNTRVIYNVGLTTRFNLPSINPYVPLFYQSYLKFDVFTNTSIFDWSGQLYFEFYNSSYRRLSFAVGYESIYGNRDFVLNINFKNYFFERNK